MKYTEDRPNYKPGDAIQCWSRKEATHKMMELAAKGILVKDDPRHENRLIVYEVQE